MPSKAEKPKRDWRKALAARETRVLFIAALLKLWIFALSDTSIGLSLSGALGAWGTLLILAAVSVLLAPRGERRYIWWLDLVISLLIWVDVLYWRFFGDVPPVAVLAFANQTGSVLNIAAQLVKPVDLLLFLDLVAMAWVRRTNQGEQAAETAPFPLRLKKAGKKVLTGLVMLALAGVVLVNNRGGVGFQDLFVCQRTAVVNYVGLLDYHILDIIQEVVETYGEKPPLSEEDRRIAEEWYRQRRPSEPGEYFGSARGLNLIVVQAESLQSFPIGMKYQGQEITPNLNRLAQKSLYFEDAYYQAADGHTSDAEFILNTSLFPVPKGSVFFLKVQNRFDTLPGRLSQNGYYPAAFHAYYPTYWNRQEMYRALGFERFVAGSDYQPGTKIGWGLSDKDFLLQTADMLANLPQPFYAQLVTLTSHPPYEGPFGLSDFTVDRNGLDEAVANYLESIHYVDYALGQFLDQLKRDGLWDNSVVVVYGDHQANLGDPLLDLMNQAKDPYQRKMAERIPIIIHTPSLQGGKVITTPVGQEDLYPTILGLLGLESAGAYMGEDILAKGFTESDRLVVFRSGSFLSRKYYYVEGGTPQAYDRATGKQIPVEEIRTEIEEARRQLRVSDILLDHPLEEILGR